MTYKFSVRKVRSGRFQLILSYKDHGVWKQKTRVFDKLRDARTAEAQDALLAEVKTSVSLDEAGGRMTLRNFAQAYFDTRTDYAYMTIANYLACIDRCRELRDKPVRDIEYFDIVAQFGLLGHYSEGAILHTITALKIIFNAARRFRLIAVSPMDDYEYNNREQKTQRRIRTLTDEEIDFLMSRFMKSPDYYVVLALCVYTGCRIGEALAITWADVDLFRATVTINKQYGLVAPRQYGFKPVKNKNGNRTLHIPPVLVRILSTHREAGIFHMDGRLTGLRQATSVSSKIAGILPGHSVHDCRHTFATKLLTTGRDLKTIAALLGDTVQTVESTYLHYTDEMRQKAADEIDKLFG